MEDYRRRMIADIARVFRVPASMLSAGPAVSRIEAHVAIEDWESRVVHSLKNRALTYRKAVNRRRYERRFHNHAPRMKAIKVRTEAQRARAITRQAIEVRRWATLGVIFRGALDWMRGQKQIRELATPRGTYHSATRKGPGRRPLHPRHDPVIPSHGTKWLPRGFPRGY